MADRGEVRGCVILTDLYYSVEDHTWARVNDDDTVTVGMTDVAQNLSGAVLHAKVKKVGANRKKGKPIGTVESSKWVGPIKTPISGEIVEINDALAGDPKILNRSPYKKGWFVKMKPDNLDGDLATMITGDAAIEAYREKIEKDDLHVCEHLEGFED